ncbi:hypothetical protein CHS0354_024057 [Potamilus streckersoni]|uniref:Peptide deformylase n=1 Tax=Potamilus streckersoni TaxID=2493646 RepID=A0AAE0VLP4_9BIVA|nr:hypothetical protein CHS0354_024057 [Potamilus streckersoni]
MAIHPIVLYGSPVLRKKAKPVTADNMSTLIPLIEDMYETMHNAHGVGLAAPQIGKSIRMFVIDVSPIEEYKHSVPFVVINPHILAVSNDQNSYEEGCLSIPFLKGDVMRPTNIKLKFRDEKFVSKTLVFNDFLARVIQHEFDHLNGVLFIDKMSKTSKAGLSEKLQAIQNGSDRNVSDYARISGIEYLKSEDFLTMLNNNKTSEFKKIHTKDRPLSEKEIIEWKKIFG